MLVLDTDHLRVLQEGPEVQRQIFLTHISTVNEDLVITIITVEEVLRGWLAQVSNYTRDPVRQIEYYGKIQAFLATLSTVAILPFDAAAARKFQELAALKLRSIGSQDLRIAAITLVHNGKLLSANKKHFSLVPSLDFEDWIH